MKPRLTWLHLASGLLLCSSFAHRSVAQTLTPGAWGKNTPGVELAAHEGTRERTSSGTVLMYNLLGKGFPADKTYDLWFWLVGKKPQKGISGVSFDKRGVLVCSGKPGSCKGKGADDPINIKTSAVLGEPKRFAVISSDGKIAGFAEAVPFPIEAKNNGCKLTVIRTSPLAEVVSVRASGFTPYEALNVKLNLGSEQSAHTPSAASDGTWQAVIGTKPPGQTSGTATISVSGKRCSVDVSFKWGEGSNQQQ